jgi:predicted metal-dependent hydrolase
LRCKIEVIKFYNYDVRLIRRPFQKRLRLSVHTDGVLRASANRSASKRQIIAFLESQKSWIEKSITEMDSLKSRYPEKKFETGESYPYLGSLYQLNIINGKSLNIEFENQKINFYVPEQNLTLEMKKKYLQILKISYKKVASQLMLKRLDLFSQKMKLKPKSVQFRGQKSIWGSCTSENKINLNYKLIIAPIEIIDYVIIHELAHIRFKNHSKNFWQLVENYTEHRQYSKKWLSENYFDAQFL